jgi:hypothetical protein
MRLLFTIRDLLWLAVVVAIARHRRHAKDYERNIETSEAIIYITRISLMSRRLTRQKAN